MGQRFYAGVGNGRKRLNMLGAYSPDDHDYVDLRLTRENVTGEQFVRLLEALLAKHPDPEKFQRSANELEIRRFPIAPLQLGQE